MMKIKVSLPVFIGVAVFALALIIQSALRLDLLAYLSRWLAPAAPNVPGVQSAVHPGLALLSAQLRSPLALLVVLTGSFVASHPVRKVISPRKQFEQVFGPDWECEREPQEKPLRRVGRRLLPRLQTGLIFWTLPGTRYELLADLWQPPEGVRPSGLALIYFHGSGRSFWGQGFGSRALFSHLALQGHLVMEIAEQRYIEVDWSGKVADVRRATAWMKANAARYGVDPARIVLAGGGSGADIALLAAFTPNHMALTPEDAEDEDLSVAAALAYYSPAACQTPRKGLFSPLIHARPGCAPALILQSDSDLIADSKSGHSLAVDLKKAGAPVICAAYRRSGHALDLLLPGLSASHQSMLAEIDRFLALIVQPAVRIAPPSPTATKRPFA